MREHVEKRFVLGWNKSYFHFLLLIFTCIISLFLLLVWTFSDDVADIATEIALHLPLSASSAVLV